ncbi:CPBP family intramembrane glutamic endopeptidase [Psychrobacter sp. I-STPA10]|uniref:CPBP family intramembrane glutamic endopeptidase n=1 Tax=Psychrobacter sp. I-STPA10 TaxID=2585769 RepID=UPI001E570338|nr:CPBP family intramembrane glutamic endopeptidase [Psychrobacter sp. I-STPA10]
MSKYINNLKIREVLTDLFQFVKHPDDHQLNLPFKGKLQYFLITFIFNVIFLTLAVVPFLLLIDYLMPLRDNSLKEYSTILHFLSFYVVFIPLFEETVFRFFLRYRKFYRFFISRQKWDKIFPFLVYFSVLILSVIHTVVHYNNSIWFYIITPIIVFPQFVMGLATTFIRVRFKFLWGIAYHTCWNLLISIIPVIAIMMGKDYVKLKDTDSFCFYYCSHYLMSLIT